MINRRTARLTFFGLMATVAVVFGHPWAPLWDGGNGTAIHHQPVHWPVEPADPRLCGDSCGDWKPYTRFSRGIVDPRVQDPSNGGTAPQNYVNVSSSCTDKQQPSIYYYLHRDADATKDVLMFRWRVEQPAHNYATGPSAGNFGSSSPWSSAQWTVLFDVDGSGYRTLAAHLNGSSGSPAEPIDMLAGIWSAEPTQSIDYSDPKIKLLGHNPTAFIGPTNKVLNYQSNLAPTESWVNGANETVWDYGTTRATKISTSPCDEYFIDYQIPVAMLDATSVGGPKITRDTPISMLFCTANSLSNPFQKDCAINRTWSASTSTPAPFGDYISFNKTESYQQPIVSSVKADAPTSCPGSYQLTAKVQDALALANGVVVPSVQNVDFYYWYDRNGDGEATAADTGSLWTRITPAASLKAQTLNTWTASWDASALAKGKYLIGVQALDDAAKLDDGMTSTGINNRTFSYQSGDGENRIYIASAWATGQQALFPVHSPVQAPSANENWFGNPSVTGNQVAVIGTAINTCGVAPTIQLNRSPASVAGGGTVNFTTTIANPSANTSAITLSSITNALPTGFAYVSSSSNGTGGVGSSDPTINGQDLTWTFGAPLNLAPGSSASLSFAATAASTSGTYNDTASAVTSFGVLQSAPVAIAVDSARVSLSISPNAYSIAADGTTPLTFTLRYANDSGVPVTSATIVNPLPVGATYVSCSGGTSCGFGAGNVSFAIGSIAGGATGSVSYTLTVPNSWATSSLANSATLSATAPDSSVVNSSASATVAVTGLPGSTAPAFRLTKTASAPRIDPGTQVTYTMTYENYGDGLATGVVLTDTLPSGMSFAGCTGVCSQSAGVVTWSIGSVAAYSSGSRTLTVTAEGSVTPVVPFTAPNPTRNSASLTWNGGGPVTASADVGVSGQACSTYYFRNTTANVGFDGTGRIASSSPVPVASDVGTKVTGTVTNSGYTPMLQFYQDPQSTNDVPFSGNITTNIYMDRNNGQGLDIRTTVYDYDSATGTRQQLGQNISSFGGSLKGLLTFTLPLSGTLDKGHRLLWVYEATAATNNAVPLELQFGGTVTNGYSAGTTFANSNAQYCITPPANLTLANKVDTAAVDEGTTPTLKYTLTYANTGSAQATNASLVSTLPSNFTNCQYSTDNTNWFACSNAAGSPPSHTFSLGTLAGQASGTRYIRGTVPAGTVGGSTLTNTATLVSDQTGLITANATTSVTATAPAGTPALSLSLSANRSAGIPGQSVTYTATVVNVGMGPASNVIVTNALPVSAYYTFGSCSGSCNNVGGTLTWPTIASLAVGASQSFTYSMLIGASGLPSGITTVTDSANATGTGGLNETSNNVVVALNGNASLSATLVASPNSNLKPGDNVTYTLTVQNTGAANADGVNAAIDVPTYGAFSGSITASQGSGSFDAINNRVVYSGGTLVPAATATFTFIARVNSPLTSGVTTLLNSANVSATNATQTTANASATANAAPVLYVSNSAPASVPLPAGTLTSAASGTTLFLNRTDRLALNQYVSVGGTVARITAVSARAITVDTTINAIAGTPVYGSVTLSIAYRNQGDANATAVHVTETVPAGLAYYAASPAAFSSPIVGNAGTVDWSLNTVAAGAGGTLEVITFPSGASGTFTSTATMSASNAIDALDSAVIAIGGLSVTKTTTTPVRSAGGEATYSIVVANSLGSPALANVRDVLPSGFSYKANSALVGGAAIEPTFEAGDSASLRPLWANVSVPANGTLTVQFKALIDAGVGAGAYQNEVELDAAGVGILGFDALQTSAEDVTVLAAASGVLKGYVFARTGNSNASFDAAADTTLAGVRVEIHKAVSNCATGVDCFVVYTDSNGYFERVVPASSWLVKAVASTGALDATWTQIVGTNDNSVVVPDQGEVTDQKGFSTGGTFTYLVSAAAGPNGSISPATRTMNDGDTTTFTVTPDANFSIDQVTGCGGSLVGNTYTTGAITGACTVNATFVANITSYLVSTSAGPNGSIAPATRTVTSGNTTTFAVTANAGYHVDSISGCGGAFAAGTYTTGAINGVCTVSVTFAADPPNGPPAQYSITTAANPFGAGTASGGGTYSDGAAVTLTATANTGYSFSAWTENGATVATNPTFGFVAQSARALVANFAINTYTVGTNAGTGGTLSPISQSVNHGGTATFTAAAESGYTLQSITGCNGTRTNNSFTTGNVTGSCTVVATFSPVGPTIATPPPATIRARALFTDVPPTLAPEAKDGTGAPLTVELVGGPLKLRPGRHTLTWRATDAQGRTVSVTQQLDIWPTVSLGPDLVLGYGNTAAIVATLNGDAPTYPYHVSFEVTGDGGFGTRHTLASGQLTFASGSASSVSFDTLPQATSFPSHRLRVALDSAANLGARSALDITIISANAAPLASILPRQADRSGALVSRDGGLVTLHADVSDPNSGDVHTLSWTYPPNLAVQISPDSRELSFDPTLLTAGLHDFSVLASDNGNPSLSTRARATLALLDRAPTLGSGDANKNGIIDSDEGWSDAGNGIPQYLNTIGQRNVLPEDAEVTDEYLVESDASSHLRVGSRAKFSGTGGARLTPNAIPSLITPDAVTNVGGYFDLEADGLVLRQSVSIVIPQRQPIPSDAVYRLWDTQAKQWTEFRANTTNVLKSAAGEAGFCPAPGSAAYQPGLTAGYWCVEVSLEDGGPNDGDQQLNGAMMKIGGVGVRNTTAPTPTTPTPSVVTGTSKGGGGAMGAWMLLLGLLRLIPRRALLLVPAMLGASAANADELASYDHWRDRTYIGGTGMFVRNNVDADEMDARLRDRGYVTDTELRNQGRFGGSVYAGHRWRYAGFELGYTDLGRLDTRVSGDTPITPEYLRAISVSHPRSGNGLQLSALAFLPLTDELDIQGRIGLFRWRSTMAAQSTAEYDDVDDHATDLLLGLGARYRLNERWSVSLEWVGYELDNEKLQTIGIGVQYRAPRRDQKQSPTPNG